MPYVTQPHSALARVETYIVQAKVALEAGQLEDATRSVGLALGAVTFAANSQTKLIDALIPFDVKGLTGTQLPPAVVARMRGVSKRDVDALRAAIAHAQGPGID